MGCCSSTAKVEPAATVQRVPTDSNYRCVEAWVAENGLLLPVCCAFDSARSSFPALPVVRPGFRVDAEREPERSMADPTVRTGTVTLHVAPGGSQSRPASAGGALARVATNSDGGGDALPGTVSSESPSASAQRDRGLQQRQGSRFGIARQPSSHHVQSAAAAAATGTRLRCCVLCLLRLTSQFFLFVALAASKTVGAQGTHVGAHAIGNAMLRHQGTDCSQLARIWTVSHMVRCCLAESVRFAAEQANAQQRRSSNIAVSSALFSHGVC